MTQHFVPPERGLTLDEILAQQDMPRIFTQGKKPDHAPDTQLVTIEMAANQVEQAKIETAENASSFFLQSQMQAIEILNGGSKLAAGRAIDEALTHFLVDLKSNFSDRYAASVAALLIGNIALFLDPEKRDVIRDIVRPQSA